MRLQVLLRRLLSLLDLRKRTRKATWIVTKILIRVVIRMVTHIVLPSHLPARCGSAFLLLFLPSSIPVYPLPPGSQFFFHPGLSPSLSHTLPLPPLAGLRHPSPPKRGRAGFAAATAAAAAASAAGPRTCGSGKYRLSRRL